MNIWACLNPGRLWCGQVSIAWGVFIVGPSVHLQSRAAVANARDAARKKTLDIPTRRAEKRIVHGQNPCPLQGSSWSFSLKLIYVAAPDENGPSKIGVSQDMPCRLLELQTGCWLPLKMHFAAYAISEGTRKRQGCPEMALQTAPRSVERASLAALREMGLGLSGEWCDVTPEEAEAVIRKCAKTVGVAIKTPKEVLSADWPAFTACPGDDVALAYLSTSVSMHAAFMASGGDCASISPRRTTDYTSRIAQVAT